MDNPLVTQEIKRLNQDTIARMKRDYKQGIGLTLRDISIKYSVTFATTCYIVKTGY